MGNGTEPTMYLCPRLTYLVGGDRREGACSPQELGRSACGEILEAQFIVTPPAPPISALLLLQAPPTLHLAIFILSQAPLKALPGQH